MARRDDEKQWHDDPLVRALRSPGTAEELAREQEFRALYRAHAPRSRTGWRLGRFGFGAAAAAMTVALTAGVASAYGRVLPDPVQDFAHGVLGPVGVPAHQPRSPRPTAEPAPEVSVAPRPTADVTRSATEPATPATAGSLRPGRPTAGSSANVAPPRPVPTPGATTTPVAPAPSALPTPGASPTRPVRVVAAVTISVADRTVVVGRTVTVTGVVTAADGHRLRNRTVRLLARTPGQQWARIGTARTDRNGGVTLQTPALGETTRLQLRAGDRVRSAVVRVVVRPVATVRVAESAGTSTITVSVGGARSGDLVTAYRKRGGDLVAIGSARLDSTGTAAITVPTPKRPVRVTVVVAATGRHGRTQARATIGTKASSGQITAPQETGTPALGRNPRDRPAA